MEDCPITHGPVTHLGDPDRIPGSWLWAGSASAVGSPLMEELSIVPLPSFSDALSNKKDCGEGAVLKGELLHGLHSSSLALGEGFPTDHFIFSSEQHLQPLPSVSPSQETSKTTHLMSHSSAGNRRASVPDLQPGQTPQVHTDVAAHTTSAAKEADPQAACGRWWETAGEAHWDTLGQSAALWAWRQPQIGPRPWETSHGWGPDLLRPGVCDHSGL